MKLFGVGWTYYDYDSGSGGVSEIWSTREKAEARVTALAINERLTNTPYGGWTDYEVVEYELNREGKPL